MVYTNLKSTIENVNNNEYELGKQIQNINKKKQNKNRKIEQF
jgi:hypothetical protein